jgi:SAM-dependent methyltransferase
VDIREYNRAAWNKQVEFGNPWTIPASLEAIEAARKGHWTIYLTPTRSVPHNWLPPLQGLKILCLASGGGQQGPTLAAAGAVVTVFDNSPMQLKQDQIVAEREGLQLETVEGDMADLHVLSNDQFDAIVHPISNVFVPDVLPVWKEAYRVLRNGGVLIAGFDNPVIHMFDRTDYPNTSKLDVKYAQPYSDVECLSKEELMQIQEKRVPFEFGHTLETQIGGQIVAGFCINGFYEDNDKESEKTGLAKYMPCYIATKAVKWKDDG